MSADEVRALRVEVGRYRRALVSVIANDRTKYEHHESRPSDGKRPEEVDGGTIFLTPREIAEAALSSTADAPQRR